MIAVMRNWDKFSFAVIKYVKSADPVADGKQKEKRNKLAKRYRTLIYLK